MSKGTILITGASGYIASHVIYSFLEAGYKVIGTARSQNSIDNIKKGSFYKKFPDRVDFVIVEDISVPGAFDKAVEGVDGVIHTQSPCITANVQDNEKQLLIPAIQGTFGILESIKKVNPSVHRVVITSSFAALVDLNKGPQRNHTYTEEDWNPATYEEGKESTDGGFVYCVSKVLAEKAAFEFVEREKPNFTISIINPPPVYGPIIHHIDSLSNLGTSPGMFYSVMNGSRTEVPPTRNPTLVDVRDVGKAHLLAYEKEEAGGQRYFTTSGSFFFEEICKILIEEFPQLERKVPVPTIERDPRDYFRVDNSKSKKELGIKFYTLRETVIDTAKSFLELEKKLGM